MLGNSTLSGKWRRDAGWLDYLLYICGLNLEGSRILIVIYMIFGQQSFFRNIPPVVLNLLILNVLIFLLMTFVPAADAILTKRLALYYFSSPNFGAWQLVTYMFLHGGFAHLFFNMFALLIFGSTIERVMGSARFLFFYLTCGICAALVQMGVFAVVIGKLQGLVNNPELCREVVNLPINMAYRTLGAYPELGLLWQYVNTPMVGASGAVYGVLLAFAFLFPNAPIYLFFIPIPIKAKWLVAGYFVIELVSGVAGLNNAADNVAHFAHLGGMIFGLLLLVYWKRKGVFNGHWFF